MAAARLRAVAWPAHRRIKRRQAPWLRYATFARLGRKPSLPGKAAMPALCARVFLGLFLSRGDRCGAGDQGNPVIFTISPGWLEVMVVLSP
jgi:hypothetical protein